MTATITIAQTSLKIEPQMSRAELVLYSHVILGFALDQLSLLYAAFLTLMVRYDWTRKRFDYFGSNPESLPRSSRKVHCVAVLCLNGLWGSEAEFYPLIRSLRKSHPDLPVFTKNIDYNKDPKKQLIERLKEIATIFKKANKKGKLVLIGHSKGVELALNKMLHGKNSFSHLKVAGVIGIAGRIRMTDEAKNHHPLRSTYSDIMSRMDTLGRDVARYHKKNFYTIAGSYDWLVSPDSVLRDPSGKKFRHQQAVVASGHMGALFSERTHSQITMWLRAIERRYT